MHAKVEQRHLDIARSSLYGVMGYLGISIMTDEAVASVASRIADWEAAPRQQAGVSAEAVAKLVSCAWHRGYNAGIADGEPYPSQASIDDIEFEAGIQPLATAPPEQAAPCEHQSFSDKIWGPKAQPQAASAGARYTSGEVVRCSQCLMPLSGAPESHLPECKMRELQEQHEAKVCNDALEEAAAAVSSVHTSYHHNDPAETIGTFVRRHSAAIQERIRSLALAVEKETK